MFYPFVWCALSYYKKGKGNKAGCRALSSFVRKEEGGDLFYKLIMVIIRKEKIIRPVVIFYKKRNGR